MPLNPGNNNIPFITEQIPDVDVCCKDRDGRDCLGTLELEKVDCPVCHVSDSSDFIVSNGLQIVRCCECGLLYVSHRKKSSELARYFESEYITDRHQAETNFISIRLASLRRESRIVKALYPNGGSLLDIGSASGAFLSHFPPEEGWKVEGVEPSRFAAAFAREKFGLKIHTGFITDVKLQPYSFDVITSLDTFPLHPYPAADMAEISRLLKPGGRFAIEIPGLKFRLMKNTGLVCRLLYAKTVSLNAGVHLCYYSRQTLSDLMERHGFSLESFHPEQSPLMKSPFSRLLNHAYFYITGALYKLSSGKIDAVSKEFLVFVKNS